LALQVIPYGDPCFRPFRKPLTCDDAPRFQRLDDQTNALVTAVQVSHHQNALNGP
jgi:hypothetical protein